MNEVDSVFTNDYKKYAILSRAAYGNQEIEGYKIDPEFSNKNRTLYYKPDTNEAIYSFRGTDLKNKNDIATDILLTLGLQDLSSRFKNAKKFTKEAIKKYPNIKTTGYSLGGSQSLYINSKLGLPSITFNPFVNYQNPKRSLLNKIIYKELIKRPVNENSIIYRTTTDPISSFANLSQAKVVNMKAKHKNNHSIKNFL